MVDGQHFTTTDQYETRKSPRQLRGDLELKYSPTPKSLLEYTARYRAEQVGTEADILQNDSTAYHSRLTTHENAVRANPGLDVESAGKPSHPSDRAAVGRHGTPGRLNFTPAVYLPLNFTVQPAAKRISEKVTTASRAVLLRGVPKNKLQATLGVKGGA